METKPPEPVEQPKPVEAARTDLAPSEGLMPPTREEVFQTIETMRERSAEPGRFDTGGKFAVLYSGEATASEHRQESLGKAPGDSIHSGELAEQHTKDQSNSITLEQTPGGRELDTLAKWLKSDAFGPDEQRELKAAMEPLWADASKRFAESAREQLVSTGYVENAQPSKIYPEVERPTLGENPDHVHMPDTPLNPDGTPSKHDQYPKHMLDDKGRMHQA